MFISLITGLLVVSILLGRYLLPELWSSKSLRVQSVVGKVIGPVEQIDV